MNYSHLLMTHTHARTCTHSHQHWTCTTNMRAGSHSLELSSTDPPQGEELTAVSLSHTTKKGETPEDEGQEIKS